MSIDRNELRGALRNLRRWLSEPDDYPFVAGAVPLLVKAIDEFTPTTVSVLRDASRKLANRDEIASTSLEIIASYIETLLPELPSETPSRSGAPVTADNPTIEALLREYRDAVIEADHCYGEGDEGGVVTTEIAARESILSLFREQQKGLDHGNHFEIGKQIGRESVLGAIIEVLGIDSYIAKQIERHEDARHDD